MSYYYSRYIKYRFNSGVKANDSWKCTLRFHNRWWFFLRSVTKVQRINKFYLIWIKENIFAFVHEVLHWFKSKNNKQYIWIYIPIWRENHILDIRKRKTGLNFRTFLSTIFSFCNGTKIYVLIRWHQSQENVNKNYHDSF